jgi:hypothetical protein
MVGPDRPQMTIWRMSFAIQWVPGHSPGVKRPGRGVDHPPPSSAEVKDRVELYLYSASGPSWSVLGRAFYTYCSSTATIVTRTHLSVTLYVHCLSCYARMVVRNSKLQLSYWWTSLKYKMHETEVDNAVALHVSFFIFHNPHRLLGDWEAREVTLLISRLNLREVWTQLIWNASQ